MTTPPAPPDVANKPAARPWIAVFHLGWFPWALASAALWAWACIVWQWRHRELMHDFVLRVEEASVRTAQRAERGELGVHAAIAVTLAIALALWSAWRLRKGGKPLPTTPSWVALSCVGLPLLALPTFEYEHAWLTGLLIFTMGLAVARAAGSSRLIRLVSRGADLTARQALWAVTGGYLVFVGTMGFLAHWRFITLHAPTYDLSWEINAIAGIVRHGVPTNSVGSDWLFTSGPLPAVYFKNHVPLVYYLYAPFFALFPDPRTALWLQTIHMGAGAFGVYLIARRWLSLRWMAVVLAWVYLLNPNVQGYCLHDLHANVLVIPTLLIAAGLMEAGRLKLGLVAALVAAVCREETAIHTICLGLFWLFSPGNRSRRLAGLGTAVASVGWILFVSKWLMPHFGGQPGWRHYNLFFDAKESIGSVIKVYLFNPLGALHSLGDQLYRAEYIWLILLPLGFFALIGWRAGWFALAALPLMVSVGGREFFTVGLNYSAGPVAATFLLSIMGMRQWLAGSRSVQVLHKRRLQAAGLLLTTGILCNYLYGNILSKTYKLEYGGQPDRNWLQYEYNGLVSYTSRLPPYGARERGIWEAVGKVPRDARVSASVKMTSAFSAHDVVHLYPRIGDGHPPESQAQYIFLDKLPPITAAYEHHIAKLRATKDWTVFYENPYAIVFKRR